MQIDYTRVAGRYDANPIRHGIEVDPAVTPAVRRALDLACGTGNYLQRQIEAGLASVVWDGVDASQAMLAVAAAKVGGAVCLKHGSAEQLPYADGTFDYVVSRFAFHHFKDKLAVLRQVRRVLAPRGRFKIVNITPELSESWWLYRYFPATVAVDRVRFWDLHRLTAMLERSGFSVRVETRVPPLCFSDALTEARNRETSQLLIIDDDSYARGLAHLESDAAAFGANTPVGGPTLCELTAEMA